ncbi:right-handed parallel beta-helix repeat-containing protein [Lapillicoccus jejuensis]|uniref:Parallel beta helix pectate lyase-like protein n=1 Tax=Lapillicoccus jejuensis TaxID=402171 RepID=A0A542E676_9MICO|nr:right-handed parallel beta-helix repeat-containing protein [Lapillicoccus jejuensis]TQJ10789.1 hypothetical protein FB458_3928 [Lapillicoccus jejuensis]
MRSCTPSRLRPADATRRSVRGALALTLGLAVTGLGLGALPAQAAGTAGGGPVVSDPSSLVARTGAPGYGDPTTAPLRVVPVSTTDGLVAALKAAKPGDHLRLASGTYTGPFDVRFGGTLANPVVVEPAAGASVTLTSDVPMPTCGALGPDQDRTLTITASHVVFRNLSIVNGARVSGANYDAVQQWQSAAIANGDYLDRRDVPGSAAFDPVAQRTLGAYFSTMLGKPVVPATDVQIVGSTLTGKGVFARGLSYSVFSGNTFSGIHCGTGPAIWLSNYSAGSVISGNDIADVAASTVKHFMQEGIRLGNGSDYNAVTGNVVHDLAVGGRAFTTDQDASFNLFANNTASKVDIGFNEQMSAWGNTWTHNVVDGATTAGFSIRMQDGRFDQPSLNSSSWSSSMTCNVSRNAAVDWAAGGIGKGTFAHNDFRSFSVNKRVSAYFGSAGNTWNGAPTAPKTGVTQPDLNGC